MALSRRWKDAVNAVQTLFYDMADAVLGVINSMVNGVIDAMLAIVAPIAGTIADIGGFATRLRDTLEGGRVDFSVTRAGRIELGRIATPGLGECWQSGGRGGGGAGAGFGGRGRYPRAADEYRCGQ